MKAAAGLAVAAVAISLAVAACGGGGSSYVAKVGSKPVTKAQLQAVLDLGPTHYNGPAFPRPGSAEYRLVQEQALDFLVQQSLAHQADAKLGIKPEDRIVTHASWLKVTGGIHISDAEVQAVFSKNPKHYQPGKRRPLDLGIATQIRTQLLEKDRGAAMHRFVTDAEQRWPVTYGPGYAPVSEMALARKIWTPGAHKACDLPGGSYSWQKAREHGCIEYAGLPGAGSPACSLIDLPLGPNGFTSAEMDDGFGEYLMDNAGSCTPDPRVEAVQVERRPNETNHTPVKVSSIPRAGSATYKDSLFGWTLRYPRRLHVGQVSYGGVMSVEGVEIANYRFDESNNRPLSDKAIDLQFTHGGEAQFSPPPVRPTQPTTDTKFPIRITDASLASGTYSTTVTADGLQFDLTIRTGSSPSRQDLDALRAIVASIHFPPLRIRHFTPNNLYVLGRAASYPLGSVTEIPAGLPLPYYRKLRSGRFYLEHTADGFWQVTWPGNVLHGYKACGPHYDATHHQFTCPSGAVWDLKGRVVRNPHPARDQDDPLDRNQVSVADGYVLVSLQPPPR